MIELNDARTAVLKVLGEVLLPEIEGLVDVCICVDNWMIPAHVDDPLSTISFPLSRVVARLCGDPGSLPDIPPQVKPIQWSELEPSSAPTRLGRVVLTRASKADNGIAIRVHSVDLREQLGAFQVAGRNRVDEVDVQIKPALLELEARWPDDCLCPIRHELHQVLVDRT